MSYWIAMPAAGLVGAALGNWLAKQPRWRRIWRRITHPLAPPSPPTYTTEEPKP